MVPEYDGWVQLSKSNKNIGAGGWRVDNIFEAADSGDVLVPPRITTVKHTQLLANHSSECLLPSSNRAFW